MSIDIRNTASLMGGKDPNPTFGLPVRNVMLFSAGGWGGWPEWTDTGEVNSAWPRNGGRPMYKSRNPGFLDGQMAEIKQLGWYPGRGWHTDVAIAMLWGPPEEDRAADFGACWNSLAVKGGPSKTACVQDTPGKPCWRNSQQLYPEVKSAAWRHGIQVAPYFCIDSWDRVDDPNRGAYVLPKLQALTTEFLRTADEVNLCDAQGRWVVGTEALNNGMTAAQAQACVAYMASKPNIVWLDGNFAANPAQTPANIHKYGMAFDPTGNLVESVRAAWGDRFHYGFLHRFGKTQQQANTIPPAATYGRIPNPIQLRWLNIGNPRPVWPCVLTDWNEYAEWSQIEPTDVDGYAWYEHLRALLAQQPA